MSDQDSYPPSSIKHLYQARGQAWSRSQITDFIKALRARIDDGKRPPDHWVQLAAFLLSDAADAANETDPKKRPVAIMKALGLAGKLNTHPRDFLITTAMIWLMRDEEIKTERAAAACLAEDLLEKGVDMSEETLREIYHRMRKIGSGIVFTEHIEETLQDCEANGYDPEDVLYNVEYICISLNSG